MILLRIRRRIRIFLSSDLFLFLPGYIYLLFDFLGTVFFLLCTRNGVRFNVRFRFSLRAFVLLDEPTYESVSLI